MSIPEVDPPHELEAISEAQLQQELRSLFAVDTQHYLQRYSQIAQQLHAQSWTGDIQELYRCIHTIKGGAVTIAAEAVLSVATALEDVLSDLRYLQPAPPLTDGQLNQMLLEAGELLTGTLEFADGSSATEIEPILKRIQALHQQVRDQYLPTWNEQDQLHQEFAEQGFDLVVLDLEIALERSPTDGKIADAVLKTARHTLTQLQQIGQDLQFASGWTTLLEQAETLLSYPENAVWRSQWLRLFHAFKTCAKQGGAPVAFTLGQIERSENIEGLSADSIPDQEQLSQTAHLPSAWSSLNSDLEQPASWLEAQSFVEPFSAIETFLDDLPSHNPELAPQLNDLALDHLKLDDSELNDSDLEAAEFAEFAVPGFLDDSIVPIPSADLPDLGAQPADFADRQPQEWLSVKPPEAPPEALPAPTPSPGQSQPIFERTASLEAPDNIQIPVPLSKLDQSAQHLIDTLLAGRMTQGFYQTLQNQVMQLVSLAQEGAQYITHLRQIQDDYALLDDLRRSSQGPTPERYRQGYTTINRLLETSLRLAELGAEAEKTAQQTAESLQRLDINLLKLQNTVEDTRRIPFQNLGFRARAILRDLVTRYGKPARLVIQGEQLELDVSTLRSLEPALLHLIRNAYGHGLESAETRIAQGKPEQGTISLSLQRQGNNFQLSVGDDGCGIDPDTIQTRAKTLGLPLTQTQTPAELLSVICQPGFSSQTQVSNIAGRGVGMDVVAAQVDRLGGKLSLVTAIGQGTTFYLQVPVPHLLVSCILLQAGNRTFALPTEEIRTTMLFTSLEATPVEEAIELVHWRVEGETGSSPVLDLLAYWQPRPTPRSLPDTAVCVYVKAEVGAEIPGVWLVADDLVGQADLLISPIPSPLVAPKGLMGVSLQINGALIPVLEATAIAGQLLAPEAVVETAPPASAHDLQTLDDTPPILIVDDAALIRRRIEASLTAYGYVTHTCADGLEAWNWLQKNPATLIITDIEMPNMDGFTLTDRCRQAGVTTPVLVISSRLSEEWFREARRLGATDYLTKGFSTTELINKVNTLVNQAIRV